MDVKVGKLYQRTFPGGYSHPDDVVVVTDITEDGHTTNIYFCYISDTGVIYAWDILGFKEAMVELR